MPDDSARSTASRATWSWSTRRDSSSWRSTSRASGTRSVRFFVRLPKRPGSMSVIATSISSAPWLPRIWKVGIVRSGTSTSTVRVSSWPARSCARSFSRVPRAGRARGSAPSGRLGAAPGAAGGSSRSRRRSSTRASAFSRTSACFSRRTMSTAVGHEVAHDRVHVAADVADLGELAGLDLDEGAPARAGRGGARSRSCPTPVGPIIRMFFGVTSAATSGGRRRRRMRLRSAIATARLAAAWPTTQRSSSATISRGREGVEAAARRARGRSSCLERLHLDRIVRVDADLGGDPQASRAIPAASSAVPWRDERARGGERHRAAAARRRRGRRRG